MNLFLLPIVLFHDRRDDGKYTLSNRVGERKFSTGDSSVDIKIFSEDPRFFPGENSSLDEKKVREGLSKGGGHGSTED